MIGQIGRAAGRAAAEPSSTATSARWSRSASYSTVGSLMGFLVGKSMFIEGLFARLMYRSLYKMHQSALHGLRRWPGGRWQGCSPPGWSRG